MRWKNVFVATGIAAAFATGFGLARMTNPLGNVIPRDVVAGGGGRSMATTGHVLNATIGQPVVGVSTAGTGHILIHGFHTRVAAGAAGVRRWALY